MKVPDSLSALQAGGGPVGQSAAAGGCPSDAGCMLPGRNPCRREAGTGSRSAEEKLLCEFLEVGGGGFEKFGFTGLAAEFDLLTFVGKDDGFTHAAEFFIGDDAGVQRIGFDLGSFCGSRSWFGFSGLEHERGGECQEGGEAQEEGGFHGALSLKGQFEVS